MADNIYYPETISENEIVKDESTNLTITDSTSGDTSSPSTIEDESFPTKKIAVETIGSAINTKSGRIKSLFEFTESGAIQIGTYSPGVNGDIKISPVGIVARNSSGIETIAIDGESGDAVFAGSIQSGTVIAGDVVVGDNAVRIDGENRRMLFYDEDTGNPVILIGFE